MVVKRDEEELKNRFESLSKIQKFDLDYQAALINRQAKDDTLTAYSLFLKKVERGEYDF